MRWFVVIAACVACSSQGAHRELATGSGTGASAAGSGTGAGAAGSAASRVEADGDDMVLAKLCKSATCAGRFSRMELWRDQGGALARILFDGDIDLCSHPPRTYFDGKGNQTLGIPFEPVEPGSPKALEYQRLQSEQLAGLTKDRDASCRGYIDP